MGGGRQCGQEVWCLAMSDLVAFLAKTQLDDDVLGLSQDGSSVLTTLLNFEAKISNARTDKCTQISSHGGRMIPPALRNDAPPT